MQLKAGARLRSTVDTTEVVVVKAPSDPVDIRCGGHAMAPISEPASSNGSVEPGFDEGTQLGKRYADDAAGVELLCTKPGPGSLSVAEALLLVKGAKPLPSSD